MGVYFILLSFFIYGFIGWCTEVAFAAAQQRKFVNRGFLNGPICPVYGIGVVCVVEILRPVENRMVLLYLSSVILVTAIEWLTGFLLETLFHHKWWDYSDIPMNLNGYVCLPFSLIWGVCCVVIVRYIHPFLYHLIQMPPRWIGLVVLLVLSVAMAADLYVTVASLLKLNKRLEKMEEIANELHHLSDKIGSNISKNVLDGIQKQEDTREKAEALMEEQRAKIQELKRKYRELAEEGSAVGKRMVKAFPKMQPRQHKREFQDLKEYLLRRKENKK